MNGSLRLYTPKLRPTEKFVATVIPTITAYVPVSFSKWRLNAISHRRRHLFKAIQRSSYLPVKSPTIVDASIETTTYFVLSENFLISMMPDHRLPVFQDTPQKILKAKEEEKHMSGYYNIMPTLFSKDKDYTEMNISDNQISASRSLLHCDVFSTKQSLPASDDTVLRSLSLNTYVIQ